MTETASERAAENVGVFPVGFAAAAHTVHIGIDDFRSWTWEAASRFKSFT